MSDITILALVLSPIMFAAVVDWIAMSHRKVGGLHFVKAWRLNVSWSVSRRP